MNGQKDKYMYNDEKTTRGKDGNMNTRNRQQDRTRKVKIGDIVIIKGESRNRGHWKIGKVS